MAALEQSVTPSSGAPHLSRRPAPSFYSLIQYLQACLKSLGLLLVDSPLLRLPFGPLNVFRRFLCVIFYSLANHENQAVRSRQSAASMVLLVPLTGYRNVRHRRRRRPERRAYTTIRRQAWRKTRRPTPIGKPT